MTEVRIALEHPGLLVGLLEARGVAAGPAPEPLAREVDLLVARRSAEEFPPEALRAEVRDLLRHGGYKPTGRGKPASEYLAGAARRGDFPRISAVVDAANLASLESGLPITLLDLDRALAGAAALEIRLGRPGERYVFNPAGQEIDLEGLVLVARAEGAPLGNPVKDSLETRTRAETRNVLGVVYAPARSVGEDALNALLDAFARRLREHAGAGSTETRVLVAA